MCACVCVCVHAGARTCMHVCIRVYVCVCVCVCVNIINVRLTNHLAASFMQLLFMQQQEGRPFITSYFSNTFVVEFSLGYKICNPTEVLNSKRSGSSDGTH